MRVAVDLDGPCYEWDKTARYMLRHYRGSKGLDEPSREWFWYGQDWHNVSKEDWKWLWNEGVKLGLFRYGHMTKDTRVGLQRLVEMGHEILIITSRPASAVEDTKEWVDFYYKGIPLVDLHILSNNEEKSSVQADILIDDNPPNVVEWAEQGRAALLFDRPWNRKTNMIAPITGSIYRVTGWKGVVTWFENGLFETSTLKSSWRAASTGATTRGRSTTL